MNEHGEHFSTWIPKAIRALRGTQTLKEVAERTGYSISYLSDIEHGRTVPTLVALDRIASRCGVSLVVVVGEKLPPCYVIFGGHGEGGAG